ncbi:lysozyme inhibitor LprI family protein [Arsenophonus nasoniae]|uniref:DUF1311 domain-containing protein n=1 Tax=Arsenophonus nasoniae TaxID=638 RepID=A0AA95K3D2_9GAMM|nr:DUF1311 domain-containing protein [Arsenophonus nasoniae]WGL94860.1 DUF1311 domain-containing protein [Arsenophonus nasoniae]
MRKLTIVIMLFISKLVLADSINIDQTLEQCLAKPTTVSTLDSVDCYQNALKLWDNELNKQYQLLIADKKLSSRFKTALKKSQLAWIKYRDLNLEAINRFYDTQQGTYWGIAAMANKIELTKNKALELTKLRTSTEIGN